MKAAILLAAVAIMPNSANADRVKLSDQVIAAEGVGDGGEVYVYPGLHQSPGTFSFWIRAGDNPAQVGVITFKLNSTKPGLHQPCLFGGDSAYDPEQFPYVSEWPHNTDFRAAGNDPTTGRIRFKYTLEAPLVTGQFYLAIGICPPMAKNP